MKTPGEYALLHANGMSWSEMVDEIRAEAVADYRGVVVTLTEPIAATTRLENVVFTHNPVQDSFR